MKSLVLKGLAAAIVVAVVLVPAATAKSGNPLALLPLPKDALGAPAASLDISRPSGTRNNNGSSTLRKLGRVTGYQLTYGDFFIADPVGVSLVKTSVDQYTTAGNAMHALPFWQQRTLRNIDDLTMLNLTTAVSDLAVSGISQPHWARLQTVSVTNYGTQYIVTIEFSDDRYVLDVAVQAGSQDLATSYAVSTAHKLDKRLHRWLSGRLQGTPVALPGPGDQGPPASGPDPATMVLQGGDLPNLTLDSEGYNLFPSALSAYDAGFYPGGPFRSVYQYVDLMQSTNSAAYVAAYCLAEYIHEDLEYSAHYYVQVTPVDVSAVGDEAQAEIVTISGYGYTRSIGVVELHSGVVADLVYTYDRLPEHASDVQALAQAAADRLDAALGP